VRNMSFATNGAARLADVAQGEGTPVLLMHAGVTDKRSWGPLIEALGDRCRTIAYDQRGYGETTYQPEAHSTVGDALAVLEAQGHGRCLAAIREQVLDVA